MSHISKQSKPDSEPTQKAANTSVAAAAFADQRTSTVAQLEQQQIMRTAHSPNVIQQAQDRIQTTMQMKAGVPVNVAPVAQRMTKNAAEGVVRTVKNAVPDAGNRLFDIIATLGKSIDKNKLKMDVLSSIDNFAPFGTTDINTIATRASVANVTKGAVCDNYQEMAIAEMDRSQVGAGETVRAESYPGHSYVSVVDPVHNADRDEDLIVDPWRNMVDKRKDFNFFTKYRNAYTPYGNVAMAGQTDWLDPTISGNYYVRGFLNMSGIPDTGDLQNDMNTYIEQNPGTAELANIYPI